MAGELLFLQLLGSLVPIADFGFQAFPYCLLDLRDSSFNDTLDLLEVRLREVFYGSALGRLFSGVVGPVQVELAFE